MAISTYAELKTAVASWLNRSDLTTAIPDFIALAEADIRREVRVQAMESLASGTLTGETLAHPTRYIEARRLTVGGDIQEYVLPSVYHNADDEGQTLDIFTSIGESFYILNGASGDAYTLVYTAAFAAFSAASDTNWVLTNAPDVYLFGALRYAAIYMNDSEALTRYLAMYLAAAQRVTRQENASRYTGERLQVRAS